jgi:hypothetical protein
MGKCSEIQPVNSEFSTTSVEYTEKKNRPVTKVAKRLAFRSHGGRFWEKSGCWWMIYRIKTVRRR